jgi:hypothetical protein
VPPAGVVERPTGAPGLGEPGADVLAERAVGRNHYRLCAFDRRECVGEPWRVGQTVQAGEPSYLGDGVDGSVVAGPGRRGLASVTEPGLDVRTGQWAVRASKVGKTPVSCVASRKQRAMAPSNWPPSAMVKPTSSIRESRSGEPAMADVHLRAQPQIVQIGAAVIWASRG